MFKILGFIFGGILICLGVLWYMSTAAPDDFENPQNQNTETEVSEETEYPSITETPYVSLVDWPPTQQIIDEPLSCVVAGSPEDRAGETSIRTIGGEEFCVTEVREGAAGSVYTQYTYAIEIDERTHMYTFSAREVQCGNYSEEEARQCASAQALFDADALIGGVRTFEELYTNGPYTFEAEDQSVHIAYTIDAESALLTFENTIYMLSRTVSASGARYANTDESVIFWEHAGEARLEIDGEVVLEGAPLRSE